MGPVHTVDGGWSDWSNWGECVCDSDTDSAQQTRLRQCNNPEPQHGGLQCAGEEDDTRVCVNFTCGEEGEDIIIM